MDALTESAAAQKKGHVKLEKISIKRIDEEFPDLSYLTQEGDEYAAENKKRLDSYGVTWNHIGIKAVAEIHTSRDGRHYTINYIESGGLWGIESDSDEKYLKEIETEQIAELKDILDILGIKE